MYADLQVNGYVGVDFNDPTTSVEEVIKAAVAMREHGVVCALPTVITAGVDAMCQCIGTIVAAIEQDEDSASVFRGIHIEGPFLSPVEGFIGAHPVEHALAARPAGHRLEELGEPRVVVVEHRSDRLAEEACKRFRITRR